MKLYENKKLYTFGCSFTHYDWITWADILAKEFANFQNWAQSGGCNSFIYNSVVECIHRNPPKGNDVYCIMWTGVTRMSWYQDGFWVTPGNIFSQPKIPKDLVKKYWSDFKWYQMRDYALIYGIKTILESLGIEYYFMSMADFLQLEQYRSAKSTEPRVQQLYKPQSYVRPSVIDVVYDGDFDKYLKTNPPARQTDLYCSQVHRPDQHWAIRKPLRRDMHPFPQEHLDYITKVIPEYTVSDSTRMWVEQQNQLLLQGEYIVHSHHHSAPRRF